MKGVYGLYNEGQLFYVGSSNDVEERINNHKRDGKEFDEYRILLKCDETHLRAAETGIITLYLMNNFPLENTSNFLSFNSEGFITKTTKQKQKVSTLEYIFRRYNFKFEM